MKNLYDDDNNMKNEKSTELKNESLNQTEASDVKPESSFDVDRKDNQVNTKISAVNTPVSGMQNTVSGTENSESIQQVNDTSAEVEASASEFTEKNPETSNVSSSDNNQRLDPPYFNNFKREDSSENAVTRGSESDWRSAQYNTVHQSGSGQISYSPNVPPYGTGKVKKEKKKRGKAVGIAVLVCAGMLLSCGFGYLGAYMANSSENSSGTGGNSSATPVIYKSVETIPTSAGDGETYTYSQVEALVSDTVVEIATEYKSMGLWQNITEGAGSGVIMTEDGYIITNNHVITGTDSSSIADKIKVRLKNGDEYDAKVVGTDVDSDIALLKIEASDLSYAVFGDSEKLAVGEEVMAIGNPLGELSGTVTNGIISSLAREISVDGVTMKLLQTNAAINPGNSGGGLFNMRGELIGIVNAKSSGTGIEGLGFAIPSNDALATAEQLLEYGYVKGKPMIGISLYDVSNSAQARYLGVSTLGVYVTTVEEGYNEDILKVGDRIIAVNGNEISSGNDVIAVVKSSSVGDEIEMSLYREGKLMNVKVKCYESNGSGNVNFEK